MTPSERTSRDEWAMRIVRETAKESTCLRRHVGAILLDARGRVIATGYNGVARGMPHCNEPVQIPVYGPPRNQVWRGKTNVIEEVIRYDSCHPHACPGAGAPSGTGLDTCRAIHAEQNALLQCRDVDTIHACYVSSSPCVACVKLLMNTACVRIVFAERYAHDAESEELWMSAPDRAWELLERIRG